MVRIIERKCRDCNYKVDLYMGENAQTVITNVYCRKCKKAYTITIDKLASEKEQLFLEQNGKKYYAVELKPWVKRKAPQAKPTYPEDNKKGLARYIEKLKRLIRGEGPDFIAVPKYVTPCKECVNYVLMHPSLEGASGGDCVTYGGGFCLNCGGRKTITVSEGYV